MRAYPEITNPEYEGALREADLLEQLVESDGWQVFLRLRDRKVDQIRWTIEQGGGLERKSDYTRLVGEINQLNAIEEMVADVIEHGAQLRGRE